MIDLAGEIATAVDAAVDRAIPRILAAVAEVVRAALAEHDADRLVALAEVLGCSSAAARMRARRDPGLAGLGVPVGRRRLYRRTEVLAYLRVVAGDRR